MSEKMIAYCGLICTDCNAYKATKANDMALAQATAAEWSQMFGINVPVEAVWCDGCLVAGHKCAHCAECEIRACARQRGVENCARCDDYGCEIITKFLAMVPPAKATLDALRS